MNVKYLKLPRELDRRFKLTEEDYDCIRELRDLGYEVSYIANLFGVSRTCVYVVCDPDYKERQLQFNRVYDKSRPRRSNSYYNSVHSSIYHRKKQYYESL